VELNHYAKVGGRYSLPKQVIFRNSEKYFLILLDKISFQKRRFKPGTTSAEGTPLLDTLISI